MGASCGRLEGVLAPPRWRLGACRSLFRSVFRNLGGTESPGPLGSTKRIVIRLVSAPCREFLGGILGRLGGVLVRLGGALVDTKKHLCVRV